MKIGKILTALMGLIAVMTILEKPMSMEHGQLTEFLKLVASQYTDQG